MAEEINQLGTDSWKGNHFCFTTGLDAASRIHLATFAGDRLEIVFTRPLTNTPIFYPLCLRNAVITVDTEGVVTKFDFEGRPVFVKKLAGFEGQAVLSGKVSDGHVYVTESNWNVRKKKNVNEHRLFVVDVLGVDPVIVANYKVLWGRVLCTSTELVIIGKKKTQRIKLPVAPWGNDPWTEREAAGRGDAGRADETPEQKNP